MTLWKAVMAAWDTEADRFWMRNSVFILVNAGLIAAYAATSAPAGVRVTMAVVGIAFVGQWIRINRTGKFYLDRWKPVAKRLEARMGESVLTDLPSRKPASTKQLEWMLGAFWVGWLALLVMALLGVGSGQHKSLPAEDGATGNGQGQRTGIVGIPGLDMASGEAAQYGVSVGYEPWCVAAHPLPHVSGHAMVAYDAWGRQEDSGYPQPSTEGPSQSLYRTICRAEAEMRPDLVVVLG